MRVSLLLALALLTLHAVCTELSDDGFLATFGYLDFGGDYGGDAQDDALVRVPEDVKSSAVRDFQRYYGLPETGVVDKATKLAMETKRCGVPDKDSPDEIAGESDGNITKKKKKKNKNKRKKNKSKSRTKRYITTTTKWRNRKLTYRFLNYTSDIPQSLTRTAFKEAFSVWEDVSALQFTEETNSAITADIEISYITGKHDDNSAFNALVLGHAFFPRVGWLHMNDIQTWNYNSVRGTDTVFVAVHELGHILGLRHSKKGTIMHASYPGYRSHIKLSADDIKGVQKMYGANPCYPSNPCQNGGACRKNPQGGVGYVCSCTSGWRGTKCQTKIEEESVRRCRAITIPNGHVEPEGRLSPNQVARVYCDAGHEIVGASQFTCTFRGFYTPATVHTLCRPKILCPALSLPNGEVYPRRAVEAETVVSFSCEDGYQIAGAVRVKCRSDGTYDRAAPTCEEMVEEVVEVEEEVGCPYSFDALSSRTLGDSMIFAFKGSRYWIYTKGDTGAPKSHWRTSNKMSNANGFPNIPTHLDATFSYTDPETRERFICFVKWPQVYYWEITSREIRRVADFPTTFVLPGPPQQITAAYRWDADTIYFFVPFGYYIYKISEKQVIPSTFQPMTTFLGMPPTVTASAASKSFYTGIFYLFSGTQVYQVRLSDKQVLRNSPYEVSVLWRYGLKNCNS